MKSVSSLVVILMFSFVLANQVDACVSAPVKSAKSNHASNKSSKKAETKKVAAKKSSNSQRAPASVKSAKAKKEKAKDNHKKKAQVIPLPQKNKKVAVSKQEVRNPSSIVRAAKPKNKKVVAKASPMKPMLSYLNSKEPSENNSGDALKEDEVDNQALENAESRGLAVKHESPAVVVSDDGT